MRENPVCQLLKAYFYSWTIFQSSSMSWCKLRWAYRPISRKMRLLTSITHTVSLICTHLVGKTATCSSWAPTGSLLSSQRLRLMVSSLVTSTSDFCRSAKLLRLVRVSLRFQFARTLSTIMSSFLFQLLALTYSHLCSASRWHNGTSLS